MDGGSPSEGRCAASVPASSSPRRSSREQRSRDDVEPTWIQLNPIESNWIQLYPIVSNCIQLYPIVSDCIELKLSRFFRPRRQFSTCFENYDIISLQHYRLLLSLKAFCSFFSFAECCAITQENKICQIFMDFCQNGTQKSRRVHSDVSEIS